MSTSTPHLDLPGYDDSPAEHRWSPVDLARVVAGSARRRPWTFILVFLLGMGGASAYFVLRTPVYFVEARILAQRQQAIPSMMRTTGADEAPTRTATELIHQRENLLALIREANLPLPTNADVGNSAASRALGNPDEDPMSSLVTRLDRALKVTTGDGVITISIEWPDPQQAYHLVEAAQQNFLESRQVLDITAFDEAISLMQGRLAVLRQQMEKEEARDAAASSSVDPAPSRVDDDSRAVSPRNGQATEEMARLKSMLDSKERSVRDMEDARRRRLVDLQSQLEERRGVYSEAHPTIIALRREIEGSSRESSQLVALRAEESKLREEYRARLAAEPRPRMGSTSRPAPQRPYREGPGLEGDRLREARAQYQNMLNRVNEANLALDTARAAFRHRYTVIRPAEVPRAPHSPRPAKVFGLGAALSLLLAFVAAAMPDLRSGLIRERWQVERGLGLPVLAEVSPPEQR